jgi:hypothetical protein
MEERMKKTKLFGGLAIVGAIALVSLLSACGGSSGGGCSANPTGAGCPTPTPPTTTLPPPQVVSQGTSVSLAAEFVLRVPITTTQAGRLDVTADWTFATNDVDLILTRGNCTFDQFEAETCDVAAFAASETTKPETIRFSGAAAGLYTLFIGNFGPADESVSYQVVLAPGASSASAARASGLNLPDKVQRLRGRLERP